jgi:hypothetical protein
MEDKVKVSNDELTKLYEQMLNRLNHYYKEGFYKWVEKGNPHVAKRLFTIDEKINEVWEMAVKGEATLSMFQAGLKLYEQTVRKGCEDFEGERPEQIEESSDETSTKT